MECGVAPQHGRTALDYVEKRTVVDPPEHAEAINTAQHDIPACTRRTGVHACERQMLPLRGQAGRATLDTIQT